MSYDGWRCPQCGGVFSPFTPRCLNCHGAVPTVTMTTAPALDDVIIEIDENGKVTRGPPQQAKIVRDPDGTYE